MASNHAGSLKLPTHLSHGFIANGGFLLAQIIFDVI